ncbi:transposase [Zoogloea sp.]|uniref:IS66-like element accessory protein TnpA n=1 Tax=Zoogloea sp. TaxID=49181 RepID=UPI0035AEDD72
MEIEKAAEGARRGAYVRRSPELKAAIVAECLVPGASVAAVALAHGVNANLVRKWIEKSRPSTQAEAEADVSWLAVVPDTPPPATRASTPRGEIEIELPRACLVVRGPVDLAVLERVLASLSR